ncbi:hypothetical protein HQ545_02710 [Candidatus Woesearchaeota archaeon]|nr:hypothetical protein [Candidatus Woesearchaeota archaeon]
MAEKKKILTEDERREVIKLLKDYEKEMNNLNNSFDNLKKHVDLSDDKSNSFTKKGKEELESTETKAQLGIANSFVNDARNNPKKKEMYLKQAIKILKNKPNSSEADEKKSLITELTAKMNQGKETPEEKTEPITKKEFDEWIKNNPFINSTAKLEDTLSNLHDDESFNNTIKEINSTLYKSRSAANRNQVISWLIEKIDEKIEYIKNMDKSPDNIHQETLGKLDNFYKHIKMQLEQQRDASSTETSTTDTTTEPKQRPEPILIKEHGPEELANLGSNTKDKDDVEALINSNAIINPKASIAESKNTFASGTEKFELKKSMEDFLQKSSTDNTIKQVKTQITNAISSKIKKLENEMKTDNSKELENLIEYLKQQKKFINKFKG